MNAGPDQLDALWAEYREACPDPEASAGFMPRLWQRIEARRSANVTMLRRMAQICVAATLALTVVIGVVLIPQLEKLPVYSSTYVDAIAADHPNSYVDILTGDIK
jgi:anti-sigma-K factor RskA